MCYSARLLVMIIAGWLLLSLSGQCRDNDKLTSRIRATLVAYQLRSTNVIAPHKRRGKCNISHCFERYLKLANVILVENIFSFFPE